MPVAYSQDEAEQEKGKGKEKEAKEKTMQIIDFEGEVIEGVNRQPLDSLSQITDRGAPKKKNHFYQKRVNFRLENSETLRQLLEVK